MTDNEKMREVPPITDETYKSLMVALGMPNNRSLLSALQQIANHATQRAAWQAAKSVPVDDVKDGISSPHNACQHRDECRAKAAELGRLRKIEGELNRLKHKIHSLCELADLKPASDTAESLCLLYQHTQRLRKDAERYAVVRDSTYCDVYMHEIYLTDDDLDAAIDAAIAGEKK